MEFINALPLWGLALLIIGLRIVDVSLGTVRTIAVVQGWLWLSVFLGLFEVAVWVTAVGQVITRLNQQPLLMVAYAVGYAAGNAAGIVLERVIGLGSCVVRIISSTRAPEIVAALRGRGQRVTTFQGEGRDGPRTLIYATCRRRDLQDLVGLAREMDPAIFYAVERVAESSSLLPLPQPGGWRALQKKV